MPKVITLSGVVGIDITPGAVRESLDGAGDVEIHINSRGGHFDAALEIHNLIRRHSGKTTVLITGFALSAGSYITLAGDRVVTEDSGVYMLHNPHGGVLGDHLEVSRYAGFLKGITDSMCSSYASRCGKGKPTVQALMDAETYYYGSEIVAAGFADEVAGTEKKKDRSAAVAAARQAFQMGLSAMTIKGHSVASTVHSRAPGTVGKTRDEFLADAALRAEFGDYERYFAYCLAHHAGKTKIIGLP